MPDDPADLHRRVSALERRIRELEALLCRGDADSPAGRPDTPPDTPALAPTARFDLAEARAPTPPHPDLRTPPVPPRNLPPLDLPPIVYPTRRATTSALERPADTPSFTASIPRATPTSPKVDLERLIGGRIFAAAGAIVVVIGVGLFLSMAYQRGWMDLIPPAGKCLLGAAFGAILLCVGELVRSRINAAASAGISAAGLASLYASTWAVWGIYELVPSALAFIMLALVAGLGFLVAARAGLAMLAILALIGAYLNPMIIGEGGPAAVMPTYLLVLLVSGLSLSAWQPRPFRLLRPLVWWGTVLLGTLWAMTIGLDTPALALVFLALVWGAMHTELAISAGAFPLMLKRRSGSHHTPPHDGETARPIIPRELSWRSSRFIATSFTTTIWTVALAAWVLRHGTPVEDWLAPAFAAAVTFTLASMLAGHLTILRTWPRTDLERLGAGLITQAGGLLIVAVALALAGSAQVVAWLALGLAAAFAGRWIRSRGLDIYGIVALALGTLRLILIDAPYAGTPASTYELEGLMLSSWMLLMVMAGAAWSLTAAILLFPPDDPDSDFPAARDPLPTPWRAIANIAAVICPSLLALSLINPAADPGSIAIVWLALAIASITAARPTTIKALAVQGLVLLGLAFALMLAWQANSGPGWTLVSGGGLIISRWSIMMFLAAAASAAAAALIPSWRTPIYIHEPDPAHWLGIHHLLAAASIAAVLAAFADLDVRLSSLALVWLGIALAVLTLHSLRPRMGFDLLAIATLALAAGAWAFAWFPDWVHDPALPLLHGGFLTALSLLGSTAAWLHWLRIAPRMHSPGPTVPELSSLVLIMCTILLFAATSYEIARSATILAGDATARNAAVSIWWGIFAAALLSLGFTRRLANVRHVGLALLAMATLKAILIDLAAVAPTWRIVSFIALGLLMLTVATVYLRLSAKLAPTTPSQ